MTDAAPDAPHSKLSGNRLTVLKAMRMSLLVASVVALLDQLTKAWALRDLADGLLQWMNGGGFSPETSVVRKPVDGSRNEPPKSLGPNWNRTVAQAACRYALDLANQVLNDSDGIPHGVPFTLSCCNCDVDGPGDYYKAVDAGWFRIRFVPQSPGENFIGLCPDCE